MEEDLKKLGRASAPKPSGEARARALSAAMAAFEEQKNFATIPQGSESGRRQSSIATKLWSYFMSPKYLLATSALATILIVPTAAYVAIGMINEKTVTLGDVPVLTGGETETKGRAEALKKKEKADGGEQVDLLAGKLAEAPVAQPQLPVSDEEMTDKDAAVNAPVETLVQPDAVAPADAAAVQSEAESLDAVSPMAAAKPVAALERSKTMALPATGVVADDGILAQPTPQRLESGDRFTSKDINPVKSVASEPVSTFSIDVDTASYAYARQAIMNGRLPEPDSVRVEEMINYFPYDWKAPESAAEPFKANVTVMPAPWNANTRLLHVAIKGYDVVKAEQPAANLVFLIDVSGSMDEPNKLPLLKSAFRLLVNSLKPTDTVSIVTYAGNSGVVLEPTKASEKQKILDAIDNLSPGGSTAGADGIEAAYRLAERAFQKNGVNRIMLATDGDFNVGPSSDDELKTLIEAKRKSGIFLSVLGFGTGNYNDAMMQVLAQNGNGVAAYIDTLSEAQKTLVQEATSSLFPIAKDVKIQVEFNPAKIAEYRLIGYETRALNREDFNNDKVDAGEIGAGHRVTAIYEVTPVGSPAVLNDDLRYAEKKPATATDAAAATSDELAFVKIRYKQPTEDVSKLITMPVTEANARSRVDDAGADVRFSVAVAAFGQKLKGESQVADYSWDAIEALGEKAKGEDRFGYRSEFLKMVELAKSLKAE